MGIMVNVKLACRMYVIDSKVISLLKEHSEKNSEIKYEEYACDNGEVLQLSIIDKKYETNQYGHLVTLEVDQVMTLHDRDRQNPTVRYNETYELQIFEDVPNLNNHMAIFGSKQMDSKLIKSVTNKLSVDKNHTFKSFRLLKVAFTKKNIIALRNKYPNIQHYCVKDIINEQIDDVVIKGVNLEDNELFEKFVEDNESRGMVNFLGVTMPQGKILYVGKDGSVYSRKNFARTDKIDVVCKLYQDLHKINVFLEYLDFS